MKLTKQTLNQRTDHIYDALVVGGRAAGLSAGIYLQRYLLSTLIVDKGGNLVTDSMNRTSHPSKPRKYS